MSTRLLFNSQGATQLRNFILGTIPIFEKAVNVYQKSTIKVGGKVFSSEWDSRTFNARLGNTLRESASLCREGRPMEPVMEKIKFIQRWSKYIFREKEFYYFRARVKGILRIYDRLKAEEIKRLK